MRYLSTRPWEGSGISAAMAVYSGLSPSGGLFVPESFPAITAADIDGLTGMDYAQRASRILGMYLTDYTREELDAYCSAAYGPDSGFDGQCAPVRALDAGTHCLELWHGPTCAFKDMALQMLPRLLTGAMAKMGGGRVAILVATSGDTGSAALHGFADVPGTSIMVFYPDGGVSKAQEAQMCTMEGDNLRVVAVEGNFDDTQTGVKLIFNDESIRAAAASQGLSLSSANSINWGRLVPQVVYYVSAYADMVASGSIRNGDRVNVAVPTGNFGNILSAYYAKMMGLPIGRLVCASNSNNVLTDFFRTRTYDRMREFHRTSTPSMDILISSNLERLIFGIADRDPAVVARLMSDLNEKGGYALEGLGGVGTHMDAFWADWSSEEETLGAVADAWGKYGYLIDTHTAVAFDVLGKYRKATGDDTPALVVSTASPYKFPAHVAGAILGGDAVKGVDEYAVMKMLADATGVPVPKGLEGLEHKPFRNRMACGRDAMPDLVKEYLGL